MSDRALRITVGGLPGTGTTTLCQLLEPRLKIPYTYAGALFRAEAEARRLTLAEFGALCQQDPAADQALDDRQLDLLRAGPHLLEGRLSGWLAYRAGIPALKVWLTCDDAVRIGRLVDRDGGDPEGQAAALAERESSEADRYHRYYGINLADLSVYDLVLDSTDAPPEVLAAGVEEAVAAWRAARTD